jgi:hypothetical protein
LLIGVHRPSRAGPLRSAAFGRHSRRRAVATGLVLVATALSCGGGGADEARPSGDGAPADAGSVPAGQAAHAGGAAAVQGVPAPGPTVSRSLVTINAEQTSDCAQLAGSLVVVFDSLGDLNADEAARLDPAVITELGRFMTDIERRRTELGCGDAQWRADTCQAMVASHSPLATRFLDAECATGSTATGTGT